MLAARQDERRFMAQCITCGSELHPDRAKKYNYCMAPECQEKNLKGLTMVAVGVNKSAEQYLILDEQTKDELASGKFADQRRGSFGTSVPSSGPAEAAAGRGWSPGDQGSVAGWEPDDGAAGAAGRDVLPAGRDGGGQCPQVAEGAAPRRRVGRFEFRVASRRGLGRGRRRAARGADGLGAAACRAARAGRRW